MKRLLCSVAAAAMLSGLAANSQAPPPACGKETFDQYQLRLQALRKEPRRNDEYVAISSGGKLLFRRLHVWIRAEPVVSIGPSRSRRLTVYLDDSVGNRLRTLPECVLVEASSTARVVPSGALRLVNGKASAELFYAPGQDIARLRIAPLPSGAWRYTEVDFPADSDKSVRLLNAVRPDDVGPPKKSNRDRALESAAILLQDARKPAPGGSRFPAQRIAFTRGRVLLEAGLVEEALDAFRLGAREYDAPMCAWGEVLMLRALGDAKGAGVKAAELMRKHPDTVAAAFAMEREDELWHVPFGELFRWVQEERKGR